MATKGKGEAGRRQARRRPSRAGGKRPPAGARKERGEPPPPSAPAAEAVESAPIPLSVPEPEFVTRVPPIAPERPRASGRRAIFLDVENTSRPQHLAHVIEHLAVDRRDSQTDLIAVANWKVVGQDSARLLAQRGAHLVHSAPSTGVRDWSDLRIAVAAGIWLAAARPGDLIEIVSDDRAFDAVGDVAASLGIEFQRLSYRRLVKEDVTEIAPQVHREPEAGAPARRRRRRRGRGSAAGMRAAPAVSRHREPPPPPAPPAAPRVAAAPRPTAPARAPAAAHTAPHDELVSVVRDLVERAPGRSVTIDAVANALKSRGFQRPPGSPRLITRLRRIRDLLVSPAGAIRLAADGGADAEGAPAEPPPDRDLLAPGEARPADEPEARDDGEEGPGPGNERVPPARAGGAPRRRRRRRRGGRRPAGQAAPSG